MVAPPKTNENEINMEFNSGEEKHEAMIPRFNGTNGDEVQIWMVLVRTALRAKEISKAILDDDVNESAS